MPDFPAPAANALNIPDYSKTLNSLAQMQMSQAHTDLYHLQAQQQQNRMNALQEFEKTQDPKTFLKYGQPDLSEAYQNYGTKNQGAYQNFKAYLGATLPTVDPKDHKKFLTEQLTDAHGRGIITAPQAQSIVDEYRSRGAKAAGSWLSSGPTAVQSAEGLGSKLVEEEYKGNVNVRTHSGVKGIDTSIKASEDAGAPISPQQLNQQGQRGYVSSLGPASDPTNSKPIAQQAAAQTTPPGLPQPAFNSRFNGDPAAPAPVINPQTGTINPVSPPQMTERLGNAKDLSALPEKYRQDADAARISKNTISNLREASHDMPMGFGADYATKAATIIKPFAQALGVHTFDNPAVAAAKFDKYAQDLVSKATTDVSHRAAVQEMQLIAKSQPTRSTPREAFNDLIDGFDAIHDFRISKQTVAERYEAQKGTLKGFDSEWTSNMTPSAFRLHNLAAKDPKEAAAVIAKMKQTEEGKQMLNSIKKQIQWGEKYNAFDAIPKG